MRIKKTIAAIAVLLLGVLLASCGTTPKAPPANFAVGVMENSSSKSWINFYDENMNFLSGQKMPLKGLSNTQEALVQGGKMYTDIYGTDAKLVDKSLCYDYTSGEWKTIPTGIVSALSICATDDALYEFGNLNATPLVTRTDLKTGEITSYEFDTPDGAGVAHISVYGDTLYGITQYLQETSYHTGQDLYVIDANTMKLKNKVALTGYDNDPQLLAREDGLYFVTQYSYEKLATNSQGIPSYRLYFYSNKTGKITIYTLKEGFPMQIIAWGDRLIIAHGDNSGGAYEGRVITIFDPKEGREVKRTTLEHTIQRIKVKDDQLFVLDETHGGLNTGDMYRYQIAEDGTLRLQAKGDVLPHRDEQSYVTGYFIP